MKTFNIAYSSDVNVASLVATLNTQGTVLYNLENIRVIGLEVSDDTSASTIQSIPGVILVELDAGTTVTSHAEWHQIRLVTSALPMGQSYSPISHGDGIIVYLMDSGVDASHSEFSGSSIVNLYSHDGVFTDAQGHGTSMASLINGQTLGVSKNAIVKNVKIPFGSVTVGQLLTAFDAVLADHVATPGVKVVNCSWSVPKSQLLDSKVTELQNAGLVVVAAAGNTGIAADTLSPVGLNTVLGVAASDAYDRVISWASGLSSNYGPEVDITAPGVGVSVANISGGYVTSSGTSLSSAIVAGVVTQYIKENATMTAQQIQQLVLDSAFEDMLFRNETVYGTTPNRLLKAPYISAPKIWDKTFAAMFPVQRGTSTTLTFTTNLPITSAAHEDVSIPSNVGVTFFQAFTWVTSTFANGVLTLTVTPPADFDTGKYTLQVVSRDADNNVYTTRYALGVYAASSDELNSVEIEKYQTQDETNTTVLRVTPAVCYYNADCGKSAFCAGGNCA